MDIKEQVIRLAEIQDLARGIQEAQKVLDEAPGKIEAIEQHFRERNAEYVAVKDRSDELKADQKRREERVKELEEARNKFKGNLMQVKNQREYTAVLQEIDTVSSEISGHEEAVIKNMEEIETLSSELAAHETHIQEERVKVDEETKAVEAAVVQAKAAIEELGAKREARQEGIPKAIVRNVILLEGQRQGVFLAKVDNGICSACFVRCRPQMVQEIKRSSKLHVCDSCRRYLFHEAVIKLADSSEGDSTKAAPAM